MTTRVYRSVVALALAFWFTDASAHFFGTSYSLPIPFWMYAYGAAAALLVSFALVGYFVNARSAQQKFRTWDLNGSRFFRKVALPAVAASLRGLSVLALCLTILTGLFGNPSAFANFSMTFFWIIFALGFTYLSAIVGDVYAFVDPWRVLCEWLKRLKSGTSDGLLHYPARLQYWPALVLYILFIWVELFGHTQPRSLAVILIGYSVITLSGMWMFGIQTWIRYGEVFAIVFRLIAKMAPVEYGRSSYGDRRLRFRQPFIGLVRDPADHVSLVVFVLFMLSSTAFDGIHDTLPWIAIFWTGIYPIIDPIVAKWSARPYMVAPDIYYAWQWLMLIISPFIYYAIYILFIWLTKLVAKSQTSVHELSLRFALTLVPIAFVYNLTHYFTLLIGQSPSLVTLISDPFGRGWNIFDTRDLTLPTIIPSAGFVWHFQVWVILTGHIVSVYLAHLQALREFGSGRRATQSQMPMLVLMVLFTTFGLWILSLPIASGQIVQPSAAPGR